MSQGPSTLGTMMTSSLSPISVTSVVRSSSTHGESSALTRVHSCVSPKSVDLPTRTSPARAASLRSTGTASSRLPSTMSALAIVSGSLATIFSLEASKKWIIRLGGKGISRSGSGAPTARGWKKSRGLRMGGTLVERLRVTRRAPPPTARVEGRMTSLEAKSFVLRREKFEGLRNDGRQVGLDRDVIEAVDAETLFAQLSVAALVGG